MLLQPAANITAAHIATRADQDDSRRAVMVPSLSSRVGRTINAMGRVRVTAGGGRRGSRKTAKEARSSDT
jgi:hypothetical protein